MVRLLDYHKSGGKLYFVMELATGKDLFYGVVVYMYIYTCVCMRVCVYACVCTLSWNLLRARTSSTAW